MARIRQSVIKSTKSRKRKVGEDSGYIQCNVCHGSGRIKNWHKKKK